MVSVALAGRPRVAPPVAPSSVSLIVSLFSVRPSPRIGTEKVFLISFAPKSRTPAVVV
jgi:hypothetical protein